MYETIKLNPNSINSYHYSYSYYFLIFFLGLGLLNKFWNYCHPFLTSLGPRFKNSSFMYFLPREVRSKGKLSPPWKFRTASAASFPLRPHFRWQRNHLLTTRNRRSVHRVLRSFPTASCLTTRPWSRRFVHRSLERSFAANFDARWLMSSRPIEDSFVDRYWQYL